MKYNSPKEIGLGEYVIYQGRSYQVLVNYIIGETDKTGYTPQKNRTILLDSEGKKTVVNDYRTMEVVR